MFRNEQKKHLKALYIGLLETSKTSVPFENSILIPLKLSKMIIEQFMR